MKRKLGGGPPRSEVRRYTAVPATSSNRAFMVTPLVSFLEVVRLRDHRNQIRVDDALIRSQEPEPSYTGRSHDRPVGGIAQRCAQRGDLRGHLQRKGNDLKSRGFQITEKFARPHFTASGAAAK